MAKAEALFDRHVRELYKRFGMDEGEDGFLPHLLVPIYAACIVAEAIANVSESSS